MWFHPGFFPFGFIFFLLIVGFILFRVIWFNRHGGGCSWMNQEIDSLQILKQRLAKGEINEEEYLNLKEIILK